jgi:hypothetical protein
MPQGTGTQGANTGPLTSLGPATGTVTVNFTGFPQDETIDLTGAVLPEKTLFGSMAQYRGPAKGFFDFSPKKQRTRLTFFFLLDTLYSHCEFWDIIL